MVNDQIIAGRFITISLRKIKRSLEQLRLTHSPITSEIVYQQHYSKERSHLPEPAEPRAPFLILNN